MRAFVCIVLCSFVCAACGGGGAEIRPAHDAGEAQEAETPPDAGEADAQIEPSPQCEVQAPSRCPESIPHYADVAPIFAQRCSSCHNGQNGMWPLSSYQHVADWYGEIRAQMLACTMPPPVAGIAMPVEERQQILTWIRCGFPK